MRPIAFIVLVFLSTLLPVPILIALVLLYALYWPAYELIGLGLLIDAYFGVNFIWPYYTVGVFLIVILAEWAKPRLLVYNS